MLSWFLLRFQKNKIVPKVPHDNIWRLNDWQKNITLIFPSSLLTLPRPPPPLSSFPLLHPVLWFHEWLRLLPVCSWDFPPGQCCLSRVLVVKFTQNPAHTVFPSVLSRWAEVGSSASSGLLQLNQGIKPLWLTQGPLTFLNPHHQRPWHTLVRPKFTQVC